MLTIIINTIFEKLEKKNEVKSKEIRELDSSIPSLLSLNDDCISEIFKYLELVDLMSAAETCSRLQYHADSVFEKKFSQFEVDEKMIKQGYHWIKRTLSHVGWHVRSLKIDFAHTKGVDKILREIQPNCTALQSLTLKEMKVQSDHRVNYNICVENLVLNDCDLRNASSFLDNFHNLKSLRMKVYKKISPKSLENCLQNNPEIADFVLLFRSCKWNYDILETISPLVQLDHLTKLKLLCIGADVNYFLKQLAQKNMLEELTLLCVKFSRDTCKIIKSFKKLQLLNIIPFVYFDDLALLALPNLKHLRLSFFKCSFDCFISIVKEFTSLENMDLRNCILDHALLTERKIIEEILTALQLSGKTTSLTVTLPQYIAINSDLTKRYVYESNLLRIANNYYVERHGSIHDVF